MFLVLSLWTEPFSPFPRPFRVLFAICIPIRVYCTPIASMGTTKKTVALISAKGAVSENIPQKADS